MFAIDIRGDELRLVGAVEDVAGLGPPRLGEAGQLDVDGEVWRVDFAWPELRVAAEYDSVEWHGDAEALRRDRRRYQALREAGWVVVAILADDVRRVPQELIWRIAGELGRAAA